MKKVIFYILATTGITLAILGLGLMGGIDAGAPLWPNMLWVMAAGAASWAALFVAQGIAIAEGMFLDIEEDDDDGSV